MQPDLWQSTAHRAENMSHRKPKTRRKAHANPTGIFEGNPRGFGFVKTAEGDFFIPASKTNGAFDGDTVEVARVSSKREKSRSKGYRGQRSGSASAGRDEARVVTVIERVHDVVVGRYEVAGPFGVVVPEDSRITHDIFTLRRESADVADGALVRVRITEFPTKKTSATGVVLEVIDDGEDGALIEERIVAKNNLETRFSDAAVLQAQQSELDIPGALAAGYRDLRSRVVFTIDPPDAKDFDDAISVDRVDAAKLIPGSTENGEGPFVADADALSRMAQEGKPLLRLGVHIADVSNYVAWGSPIDLDARRRATSVYLADRVIPMLPEELSNGLCSLRPKEDRLCFTADLYLDADASLVAYDLYPAVMQSDRRLTYSEALDIIESDPPSSEEDPIASRIREASSISKKRQAARQRSGGIEFSTKEAKVTFSDDGSVSGIAVRQKNSATELIEEAMVFANEVVATHLYERRWPCAFRNHEKPHTDSLKDLIPVLQEFSWFAKADATGIIHGNPHAIQKILKKCEGRLEEEMVTMLFLRAMTRAEYSPRNLGHYGLGLKAYCHFTSPIRRYPDLIVHRMLKAQLIKRPEDFGQQQNAIGWLCEHSSEMERVAESASTESQKAHIVEYMQQFIGQEFDAIVSGVATYGLYVRLENCAEGLVPIRMLGNEYFIFEPIRHMLRGSDTGTVFRLGQPLRVVLTEADTRNWHLDFAIVR